MASGEEFGGQRATGGGGGGAKVAAYKAQGSTKDRGYGRSGSCSHPAKSYNCTHFVDNPDKDPTNYPLAQRVANALTCVEVEMEEFSRAMSLLQGRLGV
jgi:hypothetical protein